VTNKIFSLRCRFDSPLAGPAADLLHFIYQQQQAGRIDLNDGNPLWRLPTSTIRMEHNVLDVGSGKSRRVPAIFLTQSTL
jgi:hypothetical protein